MPAKARAGDNPSCRLCHGGRDAAGYAIELSRTWRPGPPCDHQPRRRAPRPRVGQHRSLLGATSLVCTVPHHYVRSRWWPPSADRRHTAAAPEWAPIQRTRRSAVVHRVQWRARPEGAVRSIPAGARSRRTRTRASFLHAFSAYPAMAEIPSRGPVLARTRPAAGVPTRRWAKVPSTPARARRAARSADRAVSTVRTDRHVARAASLSSVAVGDGNAVRSHANTTHDRGHRPHPGGG